MNQESGIRNQESGIRNQESGIRNQESGIRNQESGIRNQESGIRNQESLTSLTSISPTSTSRSAFTMIELVFIIVILGILGAIAVPKMAASREDAQIVAIKQDVATITQALPAYAMSQGVSNLKKFSDAVTLSSDIWKVIPKAGATTYIDNVADTLEGAAHIGTQFQSAEDNWCLNLRLVDKDSNDVADGIEVWTRDDVKCKKLGDFGTNGIIIPLTGESVKF